MIQKSPAQASNFVIDALASLKIGIWSWRGSTSKVHCCPVGANLFNVPIEAAWNGLPLHEYAAGVHPEDRARFADLISQAQRTGGPYVAEYRTLDGVGTTRSVLDRGEFELGPDGRAVAACGLVIDVTDRPEHSEIERSAPRTHDYREVPPLHKAVEHGLALHRSIDAFSSSKRYAAKVLVETLLEMLGRDICENHDKDVYRAAKSRREIL